MNEENKNEDLFNNVENKQENNCTPLKEILHSIVYPFLGGLAGIIANSFTIYKLGKYLPKLLCIAFFFTYYGLANLISYSRKYKKDFKPYNIFSKSVMAVYTVCSIIAFIFFIATKTWDIIWDIIYISAAVTALATTARFIFNIIMIKQENKEKRTGIEYEYTEEGKKQKNTLIYSTALSVLFSVVFLITLALYHDSKVCYEDEKFLFANHDKENCLKELFKHNIVPINFFDQYDNEDGTAEIAVIINEEDLLRADVYSPDADSKDENYRYYNLFYHDFKDIVRHVAAADENSTVTSFIFLTKDDSKNYVFDKKDLYHYSISKDFLEKNPAQQSIYFSDFTKNDISNNILEKEDFDKLWIINAPAEINDFIIIMGPDHFKQNLIQLTENGILNLDKYRIADEYDDYIYDLIDSGYFSYSSFIFDTGSAITDFYFANGKNKNCFGLLDYAPGYQSVYYRADYCNTKWAKEKAEE